MVKPTIKNAISGGGSQQVYEDSGQSEVMQNATPTPQQLETIAQVKGVSAETLATDTQANEASPNDAQLETISKVKDIPVDNLKEEGAPKYSIDYEMEAQIKFDVLIENFGVKEVSEALEKLEVSKDDLSDHSTYLDIYGYLEAKNKEKN